MSNSEQRTLPELIDRYKLEPKLRDIFVEGELDKGVLEWTLDVRKNHRIAVYEIETVNIPPALVLSYGVDDNNRGRVVALAHILREHLPPTSCQVSCIADTDFDTILGIHHRSDFLLFTDYCSLEMYLYNTETIEKFLQISVRGFPKSAQQTLDELTPVLENLFLTRLANHTLTLGLSEIRFEKYCSLKGGRLHFDFERYIRNYLVSNSKGKDLQRFLAEIERLRTLLVAEPKDQINGHDFIALLAWYIGRIRPKLRQTFDSVTVERALFSTIDRDKLLAEGLFTNLTRRVSIGV